MARTDFHPWQPPIKRGYPTPAMTKAKAKVTEVVRGLGVHSGLVLILKQSRSGYYGVIPAGKRWQARVYKPDKLPKPGWDPLDTFDTAYEAAIAAARAKEDIEAGLSVLSPEKRRHRKSKRNFISPCLSSCTPRDHMCTDAHPAHRMHIPGDLKDQRASHAPNTPRHIPFAREWPGGRPRG